MKKMQPIVLAMVIVLVPGLALADLVAALDFTDSGSAWTIKNVHDAGYAPTYELDGDTTKIGYATNTDSTGYMTLWQEVSVPEGFGAMTNLRLEAKVSGYSSWIMLGRISLSTVPTSYATQGTMWTGIDHLPTGVVYADSEVVIDATGHPSLNDLTSVWVGVEIVKNLSWVYVRPDVSQVRLYADFEPLYAPVPVPAPDPPNVDFTKPFEPDEATLGLWHFDQDPGDTIIPDASGNDNDAIWDHDFFGYTNVGDSEPQYIYSLEGFDSAANATFAPAPSTEYACGPITVPAGNSLSIGPDQDLTIECWVKPTYVSSIRDLVVMNGGADYAFGIYDFDLGDTGFPYFGYYPPGGSQTYYDTTPIFAGEWMHLAVTVDRTSYEDTDTIRFFNNGEFVSEWVVPAIDFIDTITNNPLYMMAAVADPAVSHHQYFGRMDELRISNVVRAYDGFPGWKPFGINWIKRVGDDIQLEFNSVVGNLYVVKTRADLSSPWVKLDGVNGDPLQTIFTDVNGVVGSNKRFYRVEFFMPESMGYVDIASKSPTVDGFLSEWTDTDMIATRDNFFEFINEDYDPMPYAQADIYGAYNEADAAYYFAFDVEEITSSDVLEFMLSDTSDTTVVDQIRFDKGGLIVFNSVDSGETEIHPRWDSSEGDTYTWADFQAEGGDLVDFTIGGSWIGEIKIPYSFVGAGHAFPSGSQTTVHFNWETGAGTKLGTTNPKKLFWPISGGAFDDPGVGVSRP